MKRKEVRIPTPLRELQQPWFPNRVNIVAENIVRNGNDLIFFNGRHQIVEVSGSETQGKNRRVNQVAAHEFFGLREKEYFKRPSDDEVEGREAIRRLREFLLHHEMELEHHGAPRHPEVYELTGTILRILPDHHLGHEHLKILALGEMKGKKLRPSEYQNPKVHMYDPVLKGPKRNYMGLLLHQIGSAFVGLIEGEDLALFDYLYKSIKRSGAIFTVDFLNGERSRKSHMFCTISPNTFLAENYMHYVTQGERFEQFIQSLKPEQRHAWNEILAIYAKYFDGIKYV